MIVIITGKAGSGKSTLRRTLLEEFPYFSKSISYTTRCPRDGETNGVDYCADNTPFYLPVYNINSIL